jgi:hypothetical protein
MIHGGKMKLRMKVGTMPSGYYHVETSDGKRLWHKPIEGEKVAINKVGNRGGRFEKVIIDEYDAAIDLYFVSYL